MFTTQNILTILISAGIPIFLWYLTLPKQKAEVAKYFSDMYTDLITELRTGRAEDRKEMELNRKEIQQQKELNHLQMQENEECKYQSALLRLQVKRLNQIVDFHGYEWERVYVLDDNPLVTKSFEHYFKEAHIQMAVFNIAEVFLTDVNEHKPCVLIIDNWLGEVQAEEVIKRLTYKPEIILMSADFSLAEKFKADGVQFFPKTDNYIFKIAQTVIKYLSDKN